MLCLVVFPGFTTNCMHVLAAYKTRVLCCTGCAIDHGSTVGTNLTWLCTINIGHVKYFYFLKRKFFQSKKSYPV